MTSDKQFSCAMGYAIVQLVEPGKTAGGLHVPATAKHYTAVLIAASEGHWHNGGFIKCQAAPGDLLVLNPDVKMFQNVDLPADHAVTELRYIAAFSRAVQA